VRELGGSRVAKLPPELTNVELQIEITWIGPPRHNIKM